MRGCIAEHSLVLNLADKALVVFTGCAHPGLVRIVEQARGFSPSLRFTVWWVGFTWERPMPEGRWPVTFSPWRVELVCPCHCTSEQAKKAMERVLGGKVCFGWKRSGFRVLNQLVT